ncbi:MAG: hypothetical protein OJF49_003543 [Ktedonobacterales bacterium]|jgi:hypothetical protein|nr:MAG: hypothetical protein OJF49_003543 [Ktedonobacterales bacterium]
MTALIIAFLLARKVVAFLVVMCIALLLGAAFPFILLADPTNPLNTSFVSQRLMPLTERIFRSIGGPPLRQITCDDSPAQRG